MRASLSRAIVRPLSLTLLPASRPLLQFKPWRYFYHNGIDGWNTFDFLVVLGSLLPTGSCALDS